MVMFWSLIFVVKMEVWIPWQSEKGSVLWLWHLCQCVCVNVLTSVFVYISDGQLANPILERHEWCVCFILGTKICHFEAKRWKTKYLRGHQKSKTENLRTKYLKVWNHECSPKLLSECIIVFAEEWRVVWDHQRWNWNLWKFLVAHKVDVKDHVLG